MKHWLYTVTALLIASALHCVCHTIQVLGTHAALRQLPFPFGRVRMVRVFVIDSIDLLADVH
jgi:hypothetical protein